MAPRRCPAATVPSGRAIEARRPWRMVERWTGSISTFDTDSGTISRTGWPSGSRTLAATRGLRTVPPLANAA